MSEEIKEKIEEIQKENEEVVQVTSQDAEFAEAPGVIQEVNSIEVKEKKMPKWLWGVLGVVVASILTAGTAYAYSQTPEQRLKSSLSLGNRYLNEMNYEQAVLEYSEALEIEPRSEEALKGILEVAAKTDDSELFQATFQSLINIYRSDETITDDEWNTLIQMALAAEQFYEESSYLEMLQDIIADTENHELKERYTTILNEAANDAWKQRNFDLVLSNLETAYKMDPDNEQIRDTLIRVVEEYVEYCRQNQKYDEAKERIEWLRELLGDQELLKEHENGIVSMQFTDGKIQAIVNQLNACFENDNIDGIMGIMKMDDWKEQMEQVSRVFYSENLLGQGDITGQGTGIYKIYGYIYVYYGNFENGIRQGEGLWYTYSDIYNQLIKYQLNWVNGIPQGPGTADYYSTVTIYGQGGVVLGEERVHIKETFETVDGIYQGECTRDGYMDDGDRYTIKNDFVDGIGVVIQTPEFIQPYLSSGAQIIGWDESLYGGIYWQRYSTSPRNVDGIKTSLNYTTTDIVLE